MVLERLAANNPILAIKDARSSAHLNRRNKVQTIMFLDFNVQDKSIRFKRKLKSNSIGNPLMLNFRTYQLFLNHKEVQTAFRVIQSDVEMAKTTQTTKWKFIMRFQPSSDCEAFRLQS